MKTTLPAQLTWTLTLYTILMSLVPLNAFAQAKGTVDCTLEWHSGHQVYTYVFKGVVSSQGKPCPNAKVQVHLSAPNQDDVVQETLALADGSYELQVKVDGLPEESADWKLVAQGPETATESAEIEGRTILTEDQNLVAVERPIQLVQG